MSLPGKFQLLKLVLLLFWITLISIFFSFVEIQIEGSGGWAANLPTWRIENHWLLDIFFGGKPLTGYHAWIISFIFLAFHLGIFISSSWSLRIEARIIASFILFWIIEDFFWFVFNPAFGLENFVPSKVHWHKHWFLGFPVEYWMFSIIALALLLLSYRLKNFQPK